MCCCFQVVPRLVRHTHWKDDAGFADVYSLSFFKSRLEGIVNIVDQFPLHIRHKVRKLNPPYHSSACAFVCCMVPQTHNAWSIVCFESWSYFGWLLLCEIETILDNEDDDMI